MNIKYPNETENCEKGLEVAHKRNATTNKNPRTRATAKSVGPKKLAEVKNTDAEATAHCFNCGSKDHLSRGCPDKEKKKERDVSHVGNSVTL